jgi:hypothetical protein
MNLSSLLIPAVLFFALGFLAKLIKSDLKFPDGMAKGLSIFLLIGIGIKGGVALSQAEFLPALNSVLAALVLGFTTPILAFLWLNKLGKVGIFDSAAIAAHYGSVSAGTFLVAIAFLDSMGQTYESYPLIMLAIMESPAIIIGLLLAIYARSQMAKLNKNADSESISMKSLLHEALTNGSVVLLLGAMLIAYLVPADNLKAIIPFYKEMFMGVLSLFLLEMGMEAAKKINEFKRAGLVLITFGITMPVVGALIGLAVAHFWLGFSIGGVFLVMVLAASASYIAVPPAMRMAIPEANPSYYLTLTLGLTFPFNVVVGIPLYYHIAQALVG